MLGMKWALGIGAAMALGFIATLTAWQLELRWAAQDRQAAMLGQIEGGTVAGKTFVVPW